jgi:hypothetical protein
MSDELNRPDGWIEVTPEELANWRSDSSRATGNLRNEIRLEACTFTAGVQRYMPHLQQEWIVETYQGGKVVAVKLEWRDVPSVMAAPTPTDTGGR